MTSISTVFKESKTYITNHWKISLGVLGAIFIVGYFFYPSAEAMTTVQYGRVIKGSVAETVSGTGQVSATSQVELKPKVNANVTQVLVAPGDVVSKGQVLFRLDARDAYKQVRDAKLNLDQADVALAKLKEPAQTIDILALENSLKKVESTKTTQDIAVATAYANLLSNGLQATPDISYTVETPPTITGTYLKKTEGQIRIGVSQGTEGSMLTLSGLVTGTVPYSSSVAQPIGDTGLFIKFNASQSNINWTIDIPNKRSTSYLSLYNAYTNAQVTRDNTYSDADRQIAEYTQKLNDLKKGAKDIDLEAQMLTVQQRQNALTDANNTLSDYTIIAPFSGSMASVSAQVGLSAVTAASNGATSLGTIVTDKKIAQITLNEADIAKVRIGQPAIITFDALNGVTATGTVADIDGLGTVTQGVVTYKVKVFFDSDDVRIKPSMSVSVDITTNSKKDVLVVQTSALKRDTNGYYLETDGTLVSQIEKKSDETIATTSRRTRNASTTGIVESASTTRSVRGTPSVTVPSTTVFTKIPVTIGIQGETMTEIVAGIEEGKRIIVKKTSGAKTQAAPSITSLFRPQGGQPRTGAAATGR